MPPRNRSSDLSALAKLSDKVVHDLSFTDIRVSKLKAELSNAAPKLPINTDISITAASFEVGTKVVIYHIGYNFAATDSEKKPAWELSFTLFMTFRFVGKPVIDEELLGAFGAVGVLQIAHPYARELVHHMTLRMRVPTFIMDVLPSDQR